MNLHQFVSPIIGAVNPNQRVCVKVSTGYTTGADGMRAPSYKQYDGVLAQVQPLTGRDLLQLDGLNLSGLLKALYLNCQIDGVVRLTMKGGDLVQLKDGTVWLVVQQLEGFNLTAGWTKIAMQLQNDTTF